MRIPPISQPPGLSDVLERVEEIRARCAALAGGFGQVTNPSTPLRAGLPHGAGAASYRSNAPESFPSLVGVSGLQSRNSVACAVSPASDIQAAIASAAARHGLDPAVLTALAHVESGFRADAVSPDGALGIAQLMPQTAREMGVADPFDLRAGLEGGARYLQEQLGRFSGNLALALAAYNAGPAAVARYGGIPPYPETQRFVSRVLDLAKRYAGR